MIPFSIGDRKYDGIKPLVMGIINITPDSFSDGGEYFNREKAVDRAFSLVEEGADIIDIGGESSRPGSDPVTEDEEIKRVIPVIESVAKKISIPVSVDTYRAEVAKRAVDSGAVLINDIRALADPDMADIAHKAGSSVVLMHMRGLPENMQDNPVYEDVVSDILFFLNERIKYAMEKGIPKDKIIVDPGIGFGKTLKHNLDILRNIEKFHDTGCAVMIGLSRKRLIGDITGASVRDRIFGTAALTALCALKGIEIHRVHDVKEIRQVCDTVSAFITPDFKRPAEG